MKKLEDKITIEDVLKSRGKASGNNLYRFFIF